jgi:uncharacterized protein YeaO (DUF488 family)
VHFFLLIKVKRAYAGASRDDGFRVLVDRLWPRGLGKQSARVDLWMKEIAPSDELRKWFSHDPARWEGFVQKYFAELKDKREVAELIVDKGAEGNVTLLFGARDEEHNNAVALAEYLKRFNCD